jgi:RNA polymerase sigma factor (sigma-70 family)
MATVPRTPDAELLRRLRSRDRLAWEELYAEFQPRLRGFAYRLAGNAHDADDLVQETFVRAVPRLDKLDPETTDVGAYLFTTLRNVFLKQVEREKRAQPVAEVPEPAVPAPIEDDPERSTLLVRQQDEVRRANAKLQPRQRLVLALRELEDRSYAEIGELVGMKENAVAQLIFRARESLRTELRLLQVDPERLPDECRRFLPLLAAHLDGQLKGAKRDETLAHLDGCERCQAALADMREASRRYRTLLPFPMGADEAKASIDARLTSAGYWDGPKRRLLARRSVQVGAVAATIALLFGGGTAAGIVLSEERQPVAAPAATTSSEKTTTAGPAATSTTEPAGTTAPETTTPESTATEAETTTEPATPESTETDAETAPAAPPDPSPEPPSEPPAPTSSAPSDTRAPRVSIRRAPSGTTGLPTAEIAFTANERGATFACRLDAAAWSLCTSPVALAELAEGAHRFSVRATDRAGNVGAPATVAWTYVPPDTTPPVVTITSAPSNGTTETGASFTFESNEPDTTFECTLDGGSFAPCTSPASYLRLPRGTHRFAIRATDAAGNRSEEISHTWTIVAPLPDLHVSAFSRFSITITNKGVAAAGPSTLTISLVGTFRVPSLAPGASITLSWSTCRVGTYTAIVDRTQVVTESDETNNTATLQNTCSSTP